LINKVEPPDFLELGLKPYREVWDLQKKLQSELIAGTGSQKIIICEHPPVITLGTSADAGNILAKEEQLKARGIELIKIERGGDVTYHGPGQLVAYPILNLNNYKRDVDWFLRLLEEIIINTMQDFGIKGVRIPGKTGVWTSPNRKIASIGVRLSRWCSMHGLALNVTNTQDGFNLINPCGLTGIEMSSLQSEGSPAQMDSVVDSFKRNFLKALNP
jgi:lipoyl(octanoyl) transferase